MKIFTLNSIGAVLAIILGVLVYYFIGLKGLLVMLLFLLVSAYITSYEHKRKRNLGLYDYQRGWQNVLSNGIMPLVFAAISAITGNIFFFLGSMASVMADKMASEIGIIDDEVYDIVGLKRTHPGVNGGVSLTGLVASLVGGWIIGISGVYLFGITPLQAFFVGICGLGGSVADSIAGHFEEMGMGSKETSNIIGSLVGGIMGFF
ncbi:MAG: DUF92 domain-containing protein, partial [Candidatus Micrarchaeota archaeon]|nr:DUF92 domain-containing protein [Candidatus Micrarchaeota archaeon]